MVDQEKKTCDLIKSKYEEISKVLALLDQQLFFEYSSVESAEKDLELMCIKGSN